MTKRRRSKGLNGGPWPVSASVHQWKKQDFSSLLYLSIYLLYVAFLASPSLHWKLISLVARYGEGAVTQITKMCCESVAMLCCHVLCQPLLDVAHITSIQNELPVCCVRSACALSMSAPRTLVKIPAQMLPSSTSQTNSVWVRILFISATVHSPALCIATWVLVSRILCQRGLMPSPSYLCVCISSLSAIKRLTHSLWNLLCI
jgi:hypothetical protein